MKTKYDKKQNVIYGLVAVVLAIYATGVTAKLVKKSEDKTHDQILLLTKDISEINKLVSRGSAKVLYAIMEDHTENYVPFDKNEVKKYSFIYYSLKIDEATNSNIVPLQKDDNGELLQWQNDNAGRFASTNEDDCGLSDEQTSYNSIVNFEVTDTQLQLSIVDARIISWNADATPPYYDCDVIQDAYFTTIIGIY